PTIGRVFTANMEALLGAARRPEDPLDPRHEAIAASLQVVYEEAALHVLTHLQRATGATRLCLAGGCAMNSVANGKIRERTAFRGALIQPAAGDNGTALGACLRAWRGSRAMPAERGQVHGQWGPDVSVAEVGAVVEGGRRRIAR